MAAPRRTTKQREMSSQRRHRLRSLRRISSLMSSRLSRRPIRFSRVARIVRSPGSRWAVGRRLTLALEMQTSLARSAHFHPLRTPWMPQSSSLTRMPPASAKPTSTFPAAPRTRSLESAVRHTCIWRIRKSRITGMSIATRTTQPTGVTTSIGFCRARSSRQHLGRQIHEISSSSAKYLCLDIVIFPRDN